MPFCQLRVLNTSAKPFYIMSEETPEEDERIDHAGGIIAAGKGKIKIVHAMKLVGFTTPERKNMTLYQKVRRRSHEMVVLIAPRTIKKSSLFEVESNITASEDSLLGTTNSSSSDRTNEDTVVPVTPRRLVASPMDNESTLTVSETSTAWQSGSNRNAAANEENESLSVKEVDSSKKRRRSSSQVQQDKAKKQKQLAIEKKGMKLATVRI